jgi:hypothetical protein
MNFNYKMEPSFGLMILFIFSVSIFIMSFTNEKKISVDGIWKIAEVQTVKTDGTITSVFPKESQVIFLKTWTSHQAESKSWQMTDSEKVNRFNQSIVNTGTYKTDKSILTTKANFAMNPMFTNGTATFNCSLLKDTLILTGTSVNSVDGVKHPAYANGQYFVNKLVKM